MCIIIRIQLAIVMAVILTVSCLATAALLLAYRLTEIHSCMYIAIAIIALYNYKETYSCMLRRNMHPAAGCSIQRACSYIALFLCFTSYSYIVICSSTTFSRIIHLFQEDCYAIAGRVRMRAFIGQFLASEIATV